MGSRDLPRKPGRPRGSNSLTVERWEQIVTMVRGGGSLRSAAETAGVPVRTVQGWIAAGSGQGTVRATPKLRAFAGEVKRARAEAQLSAEVRLHKDQPGTWLKNATANRDGDTDGTTPDEAAPDPERIWGLAKRLRDLLLLTDASELVPPCPNRRCRCAYHRERTPDELAVTRGLAASAGSS